MDLMWHAMDGGMVGIVGRRGKGTWDLYKNESWVEKRNMALRKLGCGFKKSLKLKYKTFLPPIIIKEA